MRMMRNTLLIRGQMMKFNLEATSRVLFSLINHNCYFGDHSLYHSSPR